MSAVTAVRARAVAVPVWVWLGGIVVLSAVVRIALARRVVAPWIMVDEIVYSELAKSFAAGGHLLVRGVPSHGYGFIYPVVLAPAWRLFSAVPDAYSAAKAINGVVMSLAAVPAYFLARRLLSQRLALVVAVLTVLVPSMLYTGTLMTENVFYPLFLVCALALVAMLEQPTPARQVLVLVLCALAFAARQQALALFLAAAIAPLLLGPRRLRPFATLYGILGSGLVIALLATAARGRSPLTLLGAYRAATTSSNYTVSGILHFFLYHVAELDLYVGVIPFAALLAIWLAPRDLTPPVRAFAAASFALTITLLAEVAAFASQPSVDKIEERNMFYLAPLALIALAGLAADRVVPRRRRAVFAAAAVAGILPAFVPYTRFITTSAVADTLALLPWWWVQDHWISLAQVRWAALGAGVAAAVVFALLPRRFALVLPALVAVYFVGTTYVVENGRHGIHKASLGKLWTGIRVQHPDWIDRAVGAHGRVAVLRTGNTADETIWENEFFNRSVRTVYAYAVQRVPDPLPETMLTRGAGGTLLAGGQAVQAQYVLADGSVDLLGKAIARDPRIGVVLYRVDGPLVAPTQVTGLYDDTWSGSRVRYVRTHCTGGRLSVLLGSDPSLFTRAQTVGAMVGLQPAGRVSVPPAGRATMHLQLQPRRGVCEVQFFVAHTAVPGHGDPRRLGVHFLAFQYRP